MEVFQAMPSPRKRLGKQAGLTLIEVLIALAIVGIAMTAISKALSENIRATAYLQDKTIGLWAGQYILNEARAGLLPLPDSPDKRHDTIEVLGKEWYWQAYQEETPNTHIKKMTVNVYAKEEEEASPLISLESYAYRTE